VGIVSNKRGTTVLGALILVFFFIAIMIGMTVVTLNFYSSANAMRQVIETTGEKNREKLVVYLLSDNSSLLVKNAGQTQYASTVVEIVVLKIDFSAICFKYSFKRTIDVTAGFTFTFPNYAVNESEVVGVVTALGNTFYSVHSNILVFDVVPLPTNIMGDALIVNNETYTQNNLPTVYVGYEAPEYSFQWAQQLQTTDGAIYEYRGTVGVVSLEEGNTSAMVPADARGVIKASYVKIYPYQCEQTSNLLLPTLLIAFVGIIVFGRHKLLKFTANKRGAVGLITTILVFIIILAFLALFVVECNILFNDSKTASEVAGARASEKLLIGLEYRPDTENYVLGVENVGKGPGTSTIVNIMLKDLATGVITPYILSSPVEIPLLQSKTVELPSMFSRLANMAFGVLTDYGNTFWSLTVKVTFKIKSDAVLANMDPNALVLFVDNAEYLVSDMYYAGKATGISFIWVAGSQHYFRWSQTVIGSDGDYIYNGTDGLITLPKEVNQASIDAPFFNHYVVADYENHSVVLSNGLASQSFLVGLAFLIIPKKMHRKDSRKAISTILVALLFMFIITPMVYVLLTFIPQLGAAIKASSDTQQRIVEKVKENLDAKLYSFDAVAGELVVRVRNTGAITVSPNALLIVDTIEPTKTLAVNIASENAHVIMGETKYFVFGPLTPEQLGLPTAESVYETATVFSFSKIAFVTQRGNLFKIDLEYSP